MYGIGGALALFFGRLAIKLAADLALVVQFRHPHEVGGSYFIFNVLVTIIMGLASALAHSVDTITLIMAGSCGGLLLSLIIFLLSINREYIHTFFDMRLGSKFIQVSFNESKTDKEKIKVFQRHEGKWREEIGDDVKEWVNDSLGSKTR